MPSKANVYPKQWEIWWVNLDPTVGRETQKCRPCVVLQNDIINSVAKTYMLRHF